MTKRSVVHLTSLHPALDSRIFYNECVSLARSGFDVTLIAPGEADFVKEGVNVRTIPLARGPLRRLINGYRVFSEARELPADLYHFHDPELIPFGLLLRASGRRVVMDVHEDQPGAMLHSRPSVPKPLRQVFAWVIGKVEELTGRLLTGIVTTTNHTGKRFPATKTAVVENYPNTSDAPIARRLTMRERRNEVVLTGTLGDLQCIPELVSGFLMVADELDLTLCLAGRFVPPTLENEVLSNATARRVRYLGWQPREAIYELLSHAKAGFVPYRSPHASPEFSSRKLYEYMAFGIPIIAADVRSWSDIVHTHKCGLVLPDARPESFAAALRQLFASEESLEGMSRNARQAYEDSLNWEVSHGRMLQLYEKLLAQ